LLITNLTHFLMCLFHFSTCFEQPSAHHQENQLYQYIVWYISLCRWPSGMQFRDLRTRRPPAQSDIYQMMYWY
jgi:ABC-type antimicrobial peptide transport system permease subunit